MPRYERGTFERTYAQIIHDGAAMTTTIPALSFTVRRAVNIKRLLDALATRNMSLADIVQLLDLTMTAVHKYIPILRRYAMIEIAGQDNSGRSVFKMPDDAEHVQAFRIAVNTMIDRAEKNAGPLNYTAPTLAMMAKIEAYVTKHPNTLAAPIHIALGIAKARCNKLMASMRRDGRIKQVGGDGRGTLWATGEDPQLNLSGKLGFVASRKSVTRWEPMLAGDPFALPPEFFAASPGYCTPVAHEVEPRPVVLTGFAALAQVRFELQEQRT